MEYLIRLQKKPIVVNNFLMNYYVRSVRRKVDGNDKNSVKEYLVLIAFYLTITVFIICLMIDENNLRGRLYLFDITLILGGLRQFTLYLLIFAWTGGSFIYKYFHLTKDSKVMEWIEIFDYFKGDKALADFTHPMLSPEQEDLVKFGSKVIAYLTFMVFPLVG